MTSDRAAIEKQVADTKFVNELAITLIKHHDAVLKARPHRTTTPLGMKHHDWLTRARFFSFLAFFPSFLQEVEYKPYYKYYAKVTKAYTPRTNDDVCRQLDALNELV
jgi:hypothetical protein